jgi:mRNA interferase RelE/StbE
MGVGLRMLKLAMTDRAGKFIKTLAAKQYKQVMSKCISLMDNPRPNDSIKMHGDNEYFRVDIGEYRIIYLFNSQDVSIDKVGKRNDDEVYK